MKKAKSYRKQMALRRLLALSLMIIIGFGGYKLTHFSSAATGYNHSPAGAMDSCQIASDDHATLVFGWAYDPDNGTNANDYPKVTVSVAGSTGVYPSDNPYRNYDINNYIDANYPGAPHNSPYGFIARSSGPLTKGTKYSVSGLINNVGAGANTSLYLSSAFNSDGTLPDACLYNPTPPPAPIPAPDPNITVCDLQTKQVVTIKQSQYNANPSRYNKNTSACTTAPPATGGGTPPPSGGGSGGTGTKPPASSGNHSNTSTNFAVKDDSGEQTVAAGDVKATVTAGTLSAGVEITADGAQSISVVYGTSQDALDGTTDTQTVTGDTVKVILPDLLAKTTYYYQVIRTTAGKEATSTTASFDTSGYTLALHFKDNEDKAVAGIKGVLDDADTSISQSDKDGNLQFSNLNDGTYTVTFEYKKLTYTKDFDTSSVSTDDSTSGKVVILKDTVNVSTLKNGSSTPLPSKKHSVFKIILWLFIMLLMASAIVWFVLRRRRKNLEAQYGGYTSTDHGSIDMPTAQVQPQLPPEPAPTGKPTPAPTDANGQPLEHVGESLREMVIRSMHEEAQKRHTGDPKPPEDQAK